MSHEMTGDILRHHLIRDYMRSETRGDGFHFFILKLKIGMSNKKF